MARACLVLASCVLLLGLVAAALANERSAGREEARPIAPLVAPERANSLNVAAVQVREPAPGTQYLYVRSRGVWRCATTFGAVCDSDLLTRLLGDFTGAHGVLRSRDPARAEEYGFRTSDRLEVSFHGPGVLSDEDEDRLLAFEIGSTLAGTQHGRSFVRQQGENSIYEIDRNCRDLFERDPSSSLPPLLDRRILAGPWEGRPLGFARITVTRPTSETVIEYVELTPEEVGEDGATWTWNVQEGSRTGRASVYRALGFTAFALHSRYSGFANPAEAREFGLGPGATRVTLEPREGDAIRLLVGQPTPQGFTAILHEQNRMLLQVDAETARLFTPTADMLLEESLPNPYELWLGMLAGKR